MLLFLELKCNEKTLFSGSNFQARVPLFPCGPVTSIRATAGMAIVNRQKWTCNTLWVGVADNGVACRMWENQAEEEEEEEPKEA